MDTCKCIGICLEKAHTYINGDVDTHVGVLVSSLWEIFSIVNGNPELHNYGVRLTLMLFLATFLLVVIQLRTKIMFDKKHIIAFIGTIFLIFRILTMLGFEWGWQINLYDDALLHLLSPPLEHFWNLLFFGCMAYYTLNIYDYYPGILKRIIWIIPVLIISFFVYSTITWKHFFISNLPTIMKYNQCVSDWQNHLIIAIMALYVVIIAIYKYKQYHMFISAFWTITFIEHFFRFIAFYNGYEPYELATIFHAMSTWALPLLILHFMNGYTNRPSPPVERRMIVINGIRFIKCEECGTCSIPRKESNEEKNSDN